MSDMPSWMQIVLSSATTGAVAGGIISLLGKLVLKKIEYEKEEKKVNEQRSHEYLAIAIKLESFAKVCNERIDLIDDCLHEWEQHNVDAFSDFPQRPVIDLKENLSSIFPVAFVAELDNFSKNFDETYDWISVNAEYCDEDASCDYEKECLALFGLKACEISKNVRAEISVCPGIIDAYYNKFSGLLKNKYELYLSGAGIYVIPALKDEFEKKRSLSDSSWKSS